MGVGGWLLCSIVLMYKILALAAATIWLAVLALPDNKLHLVVCDVGQGDAILVSYKTTQMLVDGGPNASVLKCLGDHMPFYDRRIEVVVLTHPQADHMNGLIDVIKRYTVLQFVKEPVANDTAGYWELMTEIRNKKLEIRSVYAGDVVKFSNFQAPNNLQFSVIWPTQEFVVMHTSPPTPLLNLGEGGPVRVGEVGVSDGTDLNNFGIVGKLSFGDFSALLTSDAGVIAPPAVADVLKVPHHGSKYGMTKEWLETVWPKLAIISVGKRNSYGHPTPEALKLLRDLPAGRQVRVLRTDQDGTVEVVSDGKSFWVRR